MDARILKNVQVALNARKQDITEGLVDTIVQIGGDPLTVRKAKDELSAVLAKARSGLPQVIGNRKKTEDMTVVISVKDLVELVTAAQQQETFGEALDAIGFKPYMGERIIVGQGRKRERLQRIGNASGTKMAL